METERLIFNFYAEKDKKEKANFISLFTDAAVMKRVAVLITRKVKPIFSCSFVFIRG